MILIQRPGQEPLEIECILVDFEGTLAVDQRVHPKAKDRINLLGKRTKIYNVAERMDWILNDVAKNYNGFAGTRRHLDDLREIRRQGEGFNFFAAEDARLFRLLLRGEFTISGLTARALHALLPDKTSGQVSRLLKRLRVHGLLKKIGFRYKYYLTDLCRQVLTLALTLRELQVVPALAHAA